MPYHLANALYLLPHESYGKYLTEHYRNAKKSCTNCHFLFNAVFTIPNAINVSHIVVAIFKINMIYTSSSFNISSVIHARAKNTIETIIEHRSEKSIA